jgi:UDP-N-acetylmuramate--alanine ligase
MLTVALQATGADPSFAIGGTITASGSNAHRGTGEFFVAEADESDGSFVAYHPYGAIITNIEHDHVDYFADENAVFAVFADFVMTIASDGFLIYCNDDKGARKLGSTVTNTRTFTYGTSPDSDLVIDQITLLPLGSSARAIWHGKVVGKLELNVPGHHNLMNAAAALSAGIVLEQVPGEMIDGLSTFKGAGRRFIPSLFGTAGRAGQTQQCRLCRRVGARQSDRHPHVAQQRLSDDRRHSRSSPPADGRYGFGSIWAAHLPLFRPSFCSTQAS